MNFRIRIISDLHIGHKASLVRDTKDIRSLAENVDLIILNGDTVESKYADSEASQKSGQPTIEEVDSEIKSWGVRSLYLTGNHDPKINQQHYLQIGGDEILITHGDGVFEDIAPWSHNSKALREVIKPLLSQKRNLDFQSYLQIIKDAEILAHQKSPNYNPTVWGKIHMFAKQAWPPTHFIGILKAWSQTPQKAAEMVQRFQVKAKYLIIGHTHKPGVWNISGTWIINTGSFFVWPGANCVDISPEGLSFRRVSKLNRRFEVQEEIKRFPLSESAVKACSQLATGKENKAGVFNPTMPSAL